MKIEQDSKITNIKPLQEITAADVVEVYSGRPGCGCGCLGKYHANPDHKAYCDKRRGYVMDNASLKSVLNILRKVQKADREDPEAVKAQAWTTLDDGIQVCYAYETDTRFRWVYTKGVTQ